MEKVSMSYLSSFSRYQAKCLDKFLFRRLQTLRFIFNQPLMQCLTGVKERKMEIQKFDKNEKSFKTNNNKLFQVN